MFFLPLVAEHALERADLERRALGASGNDRDRAYGHGFPPKAEQDTLARGDL
jgi:hypothetical protein